MDHTTPADAPIGVLSAMARGQSGAFAEAIERAILHGAPATPSEATATAQALRNELSRALEAAMEELSTTDHELLHRLSACAAGVRGIEAWLTR